MPFPLGFGQSLLVLGLPANAGFLSCTFSLFLLREKTEYCFKMCWRMLIFLLLPFPPPLPLLLSSPFYFSKQVTRLGSPWAVAPLSVPLSQLRLSCFHRQGHLPLRGQCGAEGWYINEAAQLPKPFSAPACGNKTYPLPCECSLYPLLLPQRGHSARVLSRTQVKTHGPTTELPSSSSPSCKLHLPGPSRIFNAVPSNKEDHWAKWLSPP